MTHKFYSKIVLFLSVMILVMSFATGSVAVAQNGGEPQARYRDSQPNLEIILSSISGGPGFVSISTRAFQPSSPTAEWAYYESFPPGFFNELYNPSETNTEYYYAEVSLPHNASITQLTAFYYDESSERLGVSLYR